MWWRTLLKAMSCQQISQKSRGLILFCLIRWWELLGTWNSWLAFEGVFSKFGESEPDFCTVWFPGCK